MMTETAAGGAGGEFEFAFDIPNRHDHPVYPVFSRKVFFADYNEEGDETDVLAPLRRLQIEDREVCSRSGSTSSSTSSVEDREGIWASGSVPSSPSRGKKSRSAGSLMRWRLRDVVFGRSRSDGKDKFRFLAPAEEKPPSGAAAKDDKVSSAAAEKRKTKKVTELDMVTAHRLLYGKGKSGGAGGGVSGRRSFLPYKVGFFAAGRTHHAF